MVDNSAAPGTETTDQVEGPKIVEVDQYTDPVDANDSIFDDNGELVQTLDRENNTIYKVKGKQNPIEPEKNDSTPDADSGKENSDPAASKDGNEGGNKEDGKKDDDFANPAEYILRKTGYTEAEVDLGEGVGKKKITDLTPEEQLDVVVAEFDQTIEELQQKITDLEGRKPEFKFEDKSKQQILDYLKEGGDIKKLAKEILSKDPAAQAKMLSDSEIVKLGIKREFEEWTDEEVEDELKSIEADPAKLARRAKALRLRMEKEQPDYSSLTEEQKQEKAEAVAAEKKQFDADITGVKDAAKKLKKIGEFELSDDIRNFLIKKVVPGSMEDDSDFVKGLDGNPEKLLTLQFWDTYGPKLIEKTRDHYYKLGLQKGQEGKEKLSDEPVIRTYGSSGKSVKKSETPKNLSEIPDLEKWLDATVTF